MSRAEVKLLALLAVGGIVIGGAAWLAAPEAIPGPLALGLAMEVAVCGHASAIRALVPQPDLARKWDATNAPAPAKHPQGPRKTA